MLVPVATKQCRHSGGGSRNSIAPLWNLSHLSHFLQNMD